MKIVFATDFYYPSIGGVEIETQRIARELSIEGHDVWVIAPSNSKVKNRCKDGLVSVIRIKTFLKLFTPKFLIQNKVINELKKINPDIVHIQTNLSIARAASFYVKKMHIPCVATGHYAEGEIEYRFKKIQPILKFINHNIGFFYRDVWKNTNIVTVPSDFAHRYFKKLTKHNGEIVVIPNGIYTEEYKGGFKAEPKQKTILYVGRFVASKNVEMLIRSFPEILSKIDARLILVGGGTEEKYLKNLTKKLGVEKNVFFTGFASENKVKGMYEKADVFVTASAADNQPLTILEALASGIPVVAAKVGGVPELIEEGKNGFLFGVNNSNLYIKNVLKILSNNRLRKQMGRESLKASTKYNIHYTVEQLLYVYQKAIALNSIKNRAVAIIPFYLKRDFIIKVSFLILFLGLIFRNFLISPSIAQAKNLSLKKKIMNSKVILKIEKIDTKLKSGKLSIIKR